MRALLRQPARLIDWLFVRHWRAIDAEAMTELRAVRGDDAGRHAGAGGAAGEIRPVEEAALFWRPLVILATVAVSLTLQEYWGSRSTFYELFPRGTTSLRDYQLMSFAWWSGWRFLGYVIMPMLVIFPMKWWMGGPPLRSYFISLRNFFKHLWIYAVLFGLVLPAVIVAAHQPSFHHTYPFYKWANTSTRHFVIWELLYALQFVSLEFFFRGFMLSGLKQRFGAAAIFVMIVPYCMIHYGKPLPETLGAIGAGLILGTLAMRTKSIWGGVCIHIAVAWTMDYLALGACPPMSSHLPCSN